MMLGFRIVFGLLLFSGLACFLMYALSGQAHWRRLGIVIVKWTLVAAAGFFAVLIVQRVVQGMV
jgi:hypothetical protein